MSDYTDMLDAVKIPLRETSKTLIDDSDILKFYNEGGRQFADKTACIRDQWLTPIVPAGGGALTYQKITDALNIFSKVTVSAALDKYRYRIEKALWFDSIQLVGATSRSEDGVINHVTPKDVAANGWLNPTTTRTYPEGFRSFFSNELELWPIFTSTTFYLLIEGRRQWVPMVATTQEVCYLPDRYKDAPVFYACYKAGLTVRDYDFARENLSEYMALMSQALDEIDKEDMVGGRIRRIVSL